MRRTTTLLWVISACLFAGFALGRVIPLAQPAALGVAQQASARGLLPLVHAPAEPSAQLEATIAALVAENAQQATQIARYGDFVSYLATQFPARDRAPTVDTLVREHANLATQVAEVYVGLGSPIPTLPPSPTFGPSPTPTRTVPASSARTTEAGPER